MKIQQSVKIYTCNSFAKTETGGNPAGVVLNADAMTEKEMLDIAAGLGFSETAFVQHSDLADFKVRFFTPVEEVELCGHATIGTFHVMASLNLLPPGSYTQETRAGVLGIEIHENKSVMMNQTPPVFTEILDKEEVADTLNIDPSLLIPELPVQVVSTGLRDIMIPVRSMGILDAIRPDFEKVTSMSRRYHAVGYHAFTLETLQQAAAYCRNFAPLYDIPEEGATGTSNGALGCYLYHYGRLNQQKAKDITMEQGYVMKRPSEIRVSLRICGNEIVEVKVGGSARNIVYIS
ncbi:MAG: PhzF family phenazine biosynthesis protein [Lachnospiraceae bacterium]